ncbi:MAG TPA: C39 family peptidase, partial [Chloroflexia bacterium]|nr:C39 family peptidase [Chloroflexia bacterium]
LDYLVQQNAIKAGAGLYRYDVFTSIASKYGLKAVYSEDKNVDAHFNQVLSYLKQGEPVIMNVLDPTYFPAGHFVVATGINSDGTIAVMNPDPVGGKSVEQNWPQDALKLYFGRMARSAVFTKA